MIHDTIITIILFMIIKIIIIMIITTNGHYVTVMRSGCICDGGVDSIYIDFR